VSEDYEDAPATVLRQPVDLDRVDGELAKSLAEEVASIAGNVMTGSERRAMSVEAFAKLCGGATVMVNDRACKQGVRLNGLCHRSGISEGHVREHFKPVLSNAAALAVRGLLLNPRTPILYDAVFEQMTSTREARSLGAANGGVRHLGLAGVTNGACCPYRLCVLATGTQHDPGRADADREAIRRFEKDLGYELPSSVPEHLSIMLSHDAILRNLVRGSKRLLASLDRRYKAEDAFPEILVVPELTTGPALPDRDVGTPYVPGQDPEMTALAAELGRPVMLSAGAVTLGRDEIERRYPHLPLPPWEWSEHFGITKPAYGAEYRGNRDTLIRCICHQDADGNVGISSQAWMLIGFHKDQRGKAIAICEHRAQERWYLDCLDAFRFRTEPGMLQAREPRIRSGIHSVFLVGNAANVTAARRPRSRRWRVLR
jgi:hypothetical protein